MDFDRKVFKRISANSNPNANLNPNPNLLILILTLKHKNLFGKAKWRHFSGKGSDTGKPLGYNISSLLSFLPAQVC